MIDLSLPLIGPAAGVSQLLAELAKKKQSLAVLVEGNPGVGKSHLLDQFALDLTLSKFAIEQLNGQAVSVDVVRTWRERCVYGNLFSKWTVKRIDEIDKTGTAAVAELLTYLDYLQDHTAILATTNEYNKLRAESRGRLETRFTRIHVEAPTIDSAVRYMVKMFRIPTKIAVAIAEGAVPDGCLPSEGVNMRACVHDARGFLAARAAHKNMAR